MRRNFRRPLALVFVLAALVSMQNRASLAAAADVPADRSAVEHALNRLTFGPQPGQVESVQKLGLSRWLDQQLNPSAIDDSALGSRLTPLPDRPDGIGRPAARNASEQQRQEMQRQNRQFARQSVQTLASQKITRAIYSERQLEEVLVDFWFNHFNVFAGKGRTSSFLPDYEREAIRPHVWGNFRELLGATAKSPAMLFYLDNWLSADPKAAEQLQNVNNRRRVRIAGRFPQGPGAQGADNNMPPQQQQGPRRNGLNENYARELMELHTLGVDGGYTQKDVIEVARALTGWSIRPPRQLLQLASDPRVQRLAERMPDNGAAGEFVFRPETHDAEAKVILGHKLKAGRGVEDGDDVLDILARHPATARYIARKLAVRFVSDSPPPALVDRAAAAFTRTNGDIREVVRTIVTSPEFFSRAAFRSKVKSPFEVVVSTLRALDAAPDATPRTAQLVARLGQPIFGHQAPNGWPETAEPWMNTGAILNRINFGMAAAANRVPGVSLDRWPDAPRLRAVPRAKQVEGVVASLLGGHVSPQTREILTTGVHPMVAQAKDSSASMIVAADSTIDADPTMAPDAPPVRRRQRLATQGFSNLPELTGLAQVVGLALGSPEFQRR